MERAFMRMSEIMRVSSDEHRRVVEYNELGQHIGESATKLKSFIGTTMRSLQYLPILEECTYGFLR